MLISVMAKGCDQYSAIANIGSLISKWYYLGGYNLMIKLRHCEKAKNLKKYPICFDV